MDRQSIESDRLHLLSEEHNLLPSAFTSQAPSILSRSPSRATLKAKDEAKDAAIAESLSPAESAVPLSKSATAARRFTKSEEEYLAALREWVEEKQYISLGPNTTLTGFYGTKTMDMYAAQPRPNWGRKKRSNSTQITAADLDINGRRKTIAAPELESSTTADDRIPGQRRKSIKNWLAKR
jgi:hypothetical protein